MKLRLLTIRATGFLLSLRNIVLSAVLLWPAAKRAVGTFRA